MRRSGPTAWMMAAAAALVLGALGCESKPEAPQAWTHTDERQGFSVTVPPGWRSWGGSLSGDFVVMPADQTDPNVYRDNFLVHLEQLPPDMTLESFFGVKAAAGGRAPPEVAYKEIERGPAMVGGVEARRLVYSANIGETPVMSMACFLVAGGRGYSLIGAAATERFPAHKADFDGMISSFKLLGAAGAAEAKKP